MRIKIILIIILVFQNALAIAQSVTPSNYPNALLKTGEAFISKIQKKDVPTDTLSGSCVYKEGTCNGAQLILLQNEKIVQSLTLTNSQEFKIPRLKFNQGYQLKFYWAKHNLEEVRNVKAGEFIQIKLE